MPSFDTISEWVLANLYLVGAVAGVLLLVVLLVLLRAAGRRRDESGRMDAYEVPYAAADVGAGMGEDIFDNADPAAPEMDGLGLPQAMPGGAGASDDVTHEDLFAVAPTPPPEKAAQVYVPPASPRGNHARDIVRGLLSEQGDITDTQLRRLELLRPEKVLEAADELEAGLHGRGTESERARLAKIRQHAYLLLPDFSEREEDVGAEQAATPYHPDPVIGDAVAIGPTREPLYEREPEQGPEQGHEQKSEQESGQGAAALHSLSPAELGRLYSSTDDKTLKLSIIDALEDAAGPESISTLQVCLDDADPEVQLHALEAAERLLAHR